MLEGLWCDRKLESPSPFLMVFSFDGFIVNLNVIIVANQPELIFSGYVKEKALAKCILRSASKHLNQVKLLLIHQQSWLCCVDYLKCLRTFLYLESFTRKMVST